MIRMADNTGRRNYLATGPHRWVEGYLSDQAALGEEQPGP